MLRHEDHGIDRVAVSSLDDVRIASSNTIEVLMENDFKLIVNDSVYVVNTPRQERLTQVCLRRQATSSEESHSSADSDTDSDSERWASRHHGLNTGEIEEELQRLSDVRNLVNQMYEALNVEEHQLHKERELCSQLEELKVELEPMEQKRQELEQIASRRTNILTWVGLGLMSVQFGILARLTWWEYSWDIMEPVTYFVTYGTAMAAYAYFVLTRQEYLLPDVKDRQHLIILHKRARKVGLDLGRYNQLKDSVAQLEADLRRLRDPLQLHLPPHHLSSSRTRSGGGADLAEPRSPLERAQAHIRSLLRRGRSATGGST